MLSVNQSFSRTVASICIVTFMLLASFAGLFALVRPASAAAGDMIVTGSFTISNEIYYIDGDVRVEPTGTLTISNAELRFVSDGAHPHSLIVNGGTLVLDRATITTHLDQINSYPYLTMIIQNGATVTASNRSVLKFPGEILVTGSTTSVVLSNTNITAHPSDLLYNYYSGVASVVDLADDGPRIDVTDSTVEMYDSTVWKLPEYPTNVSRWAGNITLRGSAQFTAVNTYLSVDFDSDINFHNTIELLDEAKAYLYGCTFAKTSTPAYDRSTAIVAGNGDSAILVPTAKVIGEDTTIGQSVDSLWSEDDGLTYLVSAGQRMAVGSFDTSGLSADPTSVTLAIKFSAAATYDGSGAVRYAVDPGPYSSLGIVPAAGDTNRMETVDMTARGIDTLAEISNLKFDFTHGGTTGTVQFDALYLIVVVGPQAYIYRWADITLTDEYGVPTENAVISAKFSGSSELDGKTAYYYTPSGISTTPPDNILAYMGKSAADYRVADSDGNVVVPYLTDVVYGLTAPNALFVGTFAFTGTYDSHSSTVQNAFDPYPRMLSENTGISMYLQIEGAWVPSDSVDISKYLIVPVNRTISGGSYIHGGDIIVRPTGLLVLQNVSFTILQNDANRSRVIVDNGGILWIENSVFDSNMPVSVQVKDGGTLIVIGSMLSASLNLDVRGGASVQVSGSEIHGDFVTNWDSSAALDFEDTVFGKAVVIDGSSYAELVNVTASSISLGGDAYARLYRWILVEVKDIAGYNMSDAVVSVRSQVTGVLHASGVTGEDGNVALKALVSTLTASATGVRETYVGNYNVTAVYDYEGTDYVSESAKIALPPYSEPLQPDNPLVYLTIPLALPDLAFGVQGIYAGPAQPTAGTTALLFAHVANVGEGATIDAFVVSFYLGSIAPVNLIGNYTVTSILQPGMTTTASVPWSVPETGGDKTIYVSINPQPRSFAERSYTNNIQSAVVRVITQPDLTVTLSCMFGGSWVDPGVGAPASYSVTFVANVTNLGETAVHDSVMVAIYQGSAPSNDTFVTSKQTTSILYQGTVLTLTFTYLLPYVEGDSLQLTFWAVVNPSLEEHGPPVRILESDYTNNHRSLVLTVFDSRPDAAVEADAISIFVGTLEIAPGQNVSFGQQLQIIVKVENLGYNATGGFVVSAQIVGKPGTTTATISQVLTPVTVSVPGYSWVNVTFDYMMQIAFPGDYIIEVVLDDAGALNEKDTDNNNVSRAIGLNYIKPKISIYPLAPAKAGETLQVSGTVKFPNDEMWPNVQVIVRLEHLSGETIYESEVASTDANGYFNVLVPVPADLKRGTYNIEVQVGQDYALANVEIEGAVGLTSQWFFWLIVIAAIAAALIVFTIYLYRQGVGKLVECGECGALIPESASKCPKCGVEFDKDMVKCSECGAWIPASSLECPNCHVRFGTTPEEEKGYEEKMREHYEETVLSKYREVAKTELGKQYSEETFEAWWMANPAYVSFEDWLAKEEEKRKAAATVMCSACGTANAKGSTVCQNCGSALPVSVEPREPREGGPGMPPGGVVVEKRVIRKPIDKKIIPKKIIKKPLDEEGGGESE